MHLYFFLILCSREVGTQLRAGDPLYSYVDETGKHSCSRWKIKELATVEEVRFFFVFSFFAQIQSK